MSLIQVKPLVCSSLLLELDFDGKSQSYI